MLLEKLKLREFTDVGRLADLPPLKSCPFCGCDGRMYHTLPSDGLVTYIVRCIKCHASGDFEVTPLQALIKWNQRP